MTTKKDLVEAHAFSRRRLVTAFLSGAPGGREVEPSRPGRTIVGGAALALLLVAGAAIASVLAPRTQTDWDKPGLVISKQTGERYVITAQGAPLRPVINVTSAQLILGAHVTPTIVSQKTLDGRVPGDDIGILGAPQQLPTEGAFVESGWTACTADGAGITVSVARRPAVAVAAGSGVTVTADGKTFWVVAEGADHHAWRYQVPRLDGEDNLLEAVGLPQEAQAARVSDAWLALFPAGGALDLESFGLGSRVGQRVSYAGQGGIAANARVGDFATVSSTGRVFLLTPDGPAPMDPFAAAIYTTTAELVGNGPKEAGTKQLPSVGQVAPTWAGAHWPVATLGSLDGPVCGELIAKAGIAPYVRLASDPHRSAWSSPPAGRLDPVADPGSGALVRSGDWGQTTSSSTWIVDDRAKVYPIQDEQTLDRLGFASYKAPLVPDAWVKVLGAGVPLSSALALCSPENPPTTTDTGAGSCS
ncbi:type VII secretion protein EccB [Nocardioides sp. BP30]|uniref:type VII secretion protein EccB n=1 Tax=Nocardioides sp. BP30 TaxID=3036374 RepID=UPI002468C2CF|nr:type VII secretion protein EccB [Nocardioides sp. BP30]WGL52755.1 type VII secretion protein EccB [Nocardioides sp. BP30]